MGKTAFILVLTEDEARGEAWRAELRERHGHLCNVAVGLREALDSIQQRAPDVVVTDARVNGTATAPPLADLLDKLAPDAALLVVGDPGPLTPRHVTLLTLPASQAPEAVLPRVAAAATEAVARRENRLLKESFETTAYETFEGIVGTTPQMRRIIERIKKAARNKLTVLILGETGAGKDLIAEAIHKQSDRARRPMKSVNCAGLNENLLESELFGHVKGAFTGAISDRKGYFVAADGGTLFLDEIGDAPASVQVKLLRALEEKEVRRVGGREVFKVNVRLVSATNKDLDAMVREGSFREDLLYRLNVVTLRVPPLRERRADIRPMADRFIARAASENGKAIAAVKPDFYTALEAHDWPGNVRQLRNIVESAVLLSPGGVLSAASVNVPSSQARAAAPVLPGALAIPAGMTLEQLERAVLEAKLVQNAGNRTLTADQLGLSRRTIQRKIKEHNLPF